MARAIILTVDDDPAVSQAITRDLRSRYGDRYRLARATSGAEALTSLEEFARRDQSVALIVSDHRMPEMTGIELLGHSKAPAPGAKLVLLTAYADTDVAITAINDIGLDHYLMKPWAPPEERLFPILDDLLGDWELENSHRFDGVRVVGNRWSERSHDTRMFLARNHVHYQWLELERDRGGSPPARRCSAATIAELPLVLLPDGTVAARRRVARDIADALGLRTTCRVDRSTTSWSSAPVRPAWPRRCTARRRGCAPRSSSARRPAGRPARAPASRTTSASPTGSAAPICRIARSTQARRLGAEMVLARSVEALEPRGCVHAVRFDDGSEIEARAVVVATGVSYRLLEAPGPRRADRARRVLRRGGERRTGAPRATMSTSSARPTPPGRRR